MNKMTLRAKISGANASSQIEYYILFVLRDIMGNSNVGLLTVEVP